MVDNKPNTQPTTNKPNQVPAQAAARVAPVQPTKSSQPPPFRPGVKGSFQMDKKELNKVSDKKWVHWALLSLPGLLLLSIVIIIYTLYFKPESDPRKTFVEERNPQTFSQNEPPPDYVKPTPLPFVQAEIDKEVLKAYFVSKTDAWNDELIEKVPAEAVTAMERYENAQNDSKRESAVNFFTILSSNTIDETDSNWIVFTIKFREKLEEEIGQPLYDF